jgi:hypothetical protein
VRRITGDTIGTFFAREVARPLGADFTSGRHIGLPASEDHRVSNGPATTWSRHRRSTRAPSRARCPTCKTFLDPPIDASMAHHACWRRAEIPAAIGQGNARSVVAVQSMVAGRGEARGVRLLGSPGHRAHL